GTKMVNPIVGDVVPGVPHHKKTQWLLTHCVFLNLFALSFALSFALPFVMPYGAAEIFAA
ncbi:MAG: hypothetical protein FWD58_06515, partial [Firmicutes bacterium]|nr:hypothetical protein [Bacillota bacterium]